MRLGVKLLASLADRARFSGPSTSGGAEGLTLGALEREVLEARELERERMDRGTGSRWGA